MNEGIEKKLNELVKEIGSIPTPQKKKLFTLIKRTDDCQKKLDKSIDGLQDSLDSLRLSVKYLIFDLEATRRENSQLKKALEDKNK
ncbi:hypothetical protein STSP2_00154 [Anaerohalosphaera lusitana]|uniref:Uncharacterized protein n=1 Tax=Anaerohalosphaera lusitana TaxID=1936003 RepID=A0A1U9NHN1_9BACT|nr:hypothetical protein [Anaerohalosphaera lusitana]AQT67016.1 hypothetical protein STSP2_00154 [Anaerohalosphaera lusitana]